MGDAGYHTGGGWLRGAESPHCCGSLACARWSIHALPPDAFFLELGGAPLLHGGGVLSYVTGNAFAFFIGYIMAPELGPTFEAGPLFLGHA